MVYTPEGFTYKSPISPMTSSPFNKPGAIISLCMFTNVLYMNKKIACRRVGSSKYNCKSIKFVNTLWALKQKLKGRSKFSKEIKKSLYNWIMHYPQVLQSPIANDYLKMKIYGYTEPQLVPKHLLQVSVRELHNNLVSSTIDGGLKEARYEYDNIIISDSALRSLLPLQFKNVVKIQGHVWLQMLHICQNYAFIITIMA